MIKQKSNMVLADCYEAVKNKELINSNNIMTTASALGYIVYHYTTPVALFTRGRWYKTKTFYSNTTTRVVNGIFGIIDEDTIDVSENDLRTLIDGGEL